MLRLPFVVAVTLWSGLALAAKHSKRTDVQVQAVQTSLTRVGKVQGRPAAQPALGAEQFRGLVAVKVQQLNDAAIKALLRLIAATDEKDPDKPDYLFRLAEHYRENKTHFMFQARQLDETIFNASSKERSTLVARQRRHEAAERAWLLRAMEVYLRVAGTPHYATYRRMDEVLFNVADMLNQAKRQERARFFFSQLIRNHPQSRFIPDAYLSFAEHYFNAGQIEEALKLYQQVGRFPSSPVHGYALYKEGWCWLNLKDPQRALEQFVKVIRTTPGSGKARIILVKEARKDAVRAYSHAGAPDRAWTFFSRIGGGYAMTMLERLAELYTEQGKFAESVLVLHRLIALEPRSAKLCRWQQSVLRSTVATKDKREQLKEALRLAAVYEAAPTRAEAVKRECRESTAGVLRELATTWHREAQTTRNRQTYALAEQLYGEYLERFPRERDAHVMRYYHAELLYSLERWAAAAEAYTGVVKADARGRHVADAAQAAVISWKNELNVDDSRRATRSSSLIAAAPGGSHASVHEPRPLSGKHRKLIAACEAYLARVKNAPDHVQVMYLMGRTYYDHNQFQPAAEIFARIATTHAGHELGEYAANLLLDCLNILQRYDELERWVARFLADRRLVSRTTLKPVLSALKIDVVMRIAEKLRREGRYAECGKRYADAANAAQDDPRWAKLLHNAAICYEAAKLIGRAIAARGALIAGKPDDPLAQRALYMIGANYHALAWYSRAAEHYEKFATQFPTEREAPEALRSAIVFRLGRGEHDRALQDARLYRQQFGSRTSLAVTAAAVDFAIGAIHEQRKDPVAIVRHYTDYLRRWRSVGGADRWVQAEVKIGEALWEQSCPVPTVNGACVKVQRVEAQRRIGATRRVVAESRKQCGPETKMRVTVVRRDVAKSAAAQKHFALALARSRGVTAATLRGDPSESAADRERRLVELRQAAATALFHQGEAVFARFLEVEFPRDLDFSASDRGRLERSKRSFARYLDDKGRQLGRAREIYQEAIKVKAPGLAIASAARIGQLFQNFADALYTAPIPRPPVPAGLSPSQRRIFIETFIDQYCEKLEAEAGKLEAKAVEGLDTCLRESTRLSWYNEWSSLCEAELNQINPFVYRLASEIRAEPRHASARVARARLVSQVR
jgi:tetratricopeptide (TPR) repeat protein